ncbi:hypothetical protein AGLY_009115 [Aphis glycines]|uniref:Uncharacterized protein n=1 Tax=Aphis glycines TaxID=307491 RepID=A0A6G0TJN4_APHGL|nr:hypothetical protein AGLY_009115 [Aphis glycines]
MGPIVYRFLWKSWRLTSVRTLQKTAENWEINLGLNEYLLKVLAVKAKFMTVKSKKSIFHTMVVGMTILVSCNELLHNAFDTIDFIDSMDKQFKFKNLMLKKMSGYSKIDPICTNRLNQDKLEIYFGTDADDNGSYPNALRYESSKEKQLGNSRKNESKSSKPQNKINVNLVAYQAPDKVSITKKLIFELLLKNSPQQLPINLLKFEHLSNQLMHAIRCSINMFIVQCCTVA